MKYRILIVAIALTLAGCTSLQYDAGRTDGSAAAWSEYMGQCPEDYSCSPKFNTPDYLNGFISTRALVLKALYN